MSHRNSKKSNRIGQSIQKHRAQRNSPYEAEAREAMDREYRSKLPNRPTPEPLSPDSSSQLSTLNSQLASLPEFASSSEISNLKSSSDSSPSAPSAPMTLSPSTPSEFAAAKTYIASKPATKAMHKLQHILDNHDFDYLNPNDVAQLSALMVVYAQLQNSAAVERISESLDQVGAGYKREPLTRELTKVLSIQDRAFARAQREKAAKERDQRRIEREAKQQLAQAAKQLRDERLFNQREDHLARKEKMVKDKLEIELTKRANLSRETVDKTSHRQHTSTKSQGATGIPAGVGSDSSSALGTQHPELAAQDATPPTQIVTSPHTLT